jgi:hypothetical protein
MATSSQPWQGPPTGGQRLIVSADGSWFWDGFSWQPTARNLWSHSGSGASPRGYAPALPVAEPVVTADGLWWWTGYGWAPTLAALAFWESERRRKLQTWLSIGAAALLLLR